MLPPTLNMRVELEKAEQPYRPLYRALTVLIKTLHNELLHASETLTPSDKALYNKLMLVFNTWVLIV